MERKYILTIIFFLFCFLFINLVFGVTITTVDSDDDVGKYSSIALDSQGNSHISYYDETNQTLNYCNDISGSWSCINFTTPFDPNANAGLYSSIAIDGENQVHISFSDVTNGYIDYCVGSGVSWSCTDIFSYDTSSIAVDSSNTPHVIMTDAGGTVRYAKKTGSIGQWFDTYTFTTGAGDGHASIAIDSNDVVHVAYNDFTQLIYCNNSGGSWSCVIADSLNDAGIYPSIAIDSNDNAHIVHQQFADYDLRYCNNAMGSWTCSNIDTSGATGFYPSIAIGPNDELYVSIYNSAGTLRLCNNSGGGWGCQNIISVDSNYLGYPVGRALAIKKGRLAPMASDTSLNFSGFIHGSFYNNTDLLYYSYQVTDIFSNFSVTLNDPVNNTNTTDTTPEVNFTVSGQSSSYNCRLIFNGSIVNTNSSTLNNTLTGISPSSPLSDSTFDYYVQCISLSSINNSETRTMTIDSTAPSLTIFSPVEQNYPYNDSINLNFSVSDDGLGLSSCNYSVVNSTGGGVMISNTVISDCLNTTFGLPGIDNDYNITLCSNDTLNNWNCSTVNFGVRVTSPSVILSIPGDGSGINSNIVYFNFTGTDSDGLDTCELWGNWSEGWHKNYSWINPQSGVENFTTVNITDGHYLYNVWCNDTVGLSDFAISNRTFIVDTVNPISNITSLSVTPNSQTISFGNNVSDDNLLLCRYSIYNSSGGIDGINKNVQFSCNGDSSATVTGFGTFTLNISAVDLAGNIGYDAQQFTTYSSSTQGGGSQSIVELEKIPTIAIKQISSTVIYSELERTIFYSRINSYCSNLISGQKLAIEDFSERCSLKKSDVEKIQGDISSEGFEVTLNDLISFYQLFSEGELEQTFHTLQTIENYNLFTSVLGITNEMLVNPPRLDRPFILWKDTGEDVKIEHVFTVNKEVGECSIISGSGFSCEVLTDNSVKMILTINATETNFFDKIFSGEMLIASKAEESRNLEVKRISLVPRVYNFSYDIAGIPAVWILILIGVLVLIFSIFFIVRSRLKMKINKESRRKK